MAEFIISLDVEADGPCPGVNSMLQLGAVFYAPDGRVLRELCMNIAPIEGAIQDPKTMAWWAEQEVKQPGLWASMTTNQMSATSAMVRFANTVKAVEQETGAQPLVVAYPAGFDFTFLYYYMCRFAGRSCVGFSSLDIKTLAMALLKSDYHSAAKKAWPRTWFNPKLRHTHNALDDARGQGHSFFKMLQQLHQGV
jgi:DNA polymerase III alpha subunit (gram-positive type)